MYKYQCQVGCKKIILKISRQNSMRLMLPAPVCFKNVISIFFAQPALLSVAPSFDGSPLILMNPPHLPNKSYTQSVEKKIWNARKDNYQP